MGEYLLISDAAKQVKVESHVLRYWEEELHLPIKRNELGHRYYTKEDVERLKERGLQLKAIKMILKDGKLDVLPEETTEKEAAAAPRMAIEIVDETVKKTVPSPVQETSLTGENREEKVKRLQWILQQMIREAVKENNQELCRELKESMVKELDYQFRQQEEREEERDGQQIRRQEEYYRQLDELLRVRSKGKRWEKKNKGSTEPSADEITLFAQKRKMPEQKVQEVCGQAEERVPSADEKAGKKKGGFFLSKKRSIV